MGKEELKRREDQRMPNWTQQQQDAISDRGHSLIVCAAAGSGKTAVLVERIVQLICEGCDVENMLVVTFTNAAAGEMRLRIGEALTRAAKERPELGVQAMALSRASISTLHRFCGNLIREHFQALGVDPSFRIADEQECGVLSAQAMEDALYACYDVGSEAFLAADACYTQEELSEIAYDVYRFMMTRPKPHVWLEEAKEQLCADARQLQEGAACRLVMQDACRQIGQFVSACGQTLALCRMQGGPGHYEAACEQDYALACDLREAAKKGYDALRSALDEAGFAVLGRKKKTDVFDEEIALRVKAQREAYKKAVKKLAEGFETTLEQAAQDIGMTRLPFEGVCELVRTYEALYTAGKRRRGVMDFNDLEHLALAALEHEDVRAALAARYRYVFVDEYQDSSAIQEAILGAFAPSDGQFMVGDVKQSIYRFRQAEPSLFLEKAARFDRPEETLARRIDLQRNFRSRANVLEGANAVFSRIMRKSATEIEYDEREMLIPGLPAREDDPPLELHVIYKNGDELPEAGEADEASGDEEDERELAAIEREAVICAARIHDLVGTPFYDAKTGKERPLAYRDIAVLMRAVRGSAPLAAQVLKSEGIPVFCDAGEGYFDIPEIRSMMALLSVIDNGAQDEALLAALRGPACGLQDGELAAIRTNCPDARVPYHEAVRRYRTEKEDALALKLRAFEEKRLFWRLCARHQGVDRLIERIYAQTGFPAQAGALPGGAARQANLHLLTSRARAFMQAQGGSLHAFLAYAKRLKAGGDSMSASAISESEDVVRIMTTHKSKGLEFPVVFVLGLGRGMRGRNKEDRILLDAQLGAALPCVDTALMSERDTLLRRAIRLKTGSEQLAEEVRILYVAMTRARERLILIGDVNASQPPQKWETGAQESSLPLINTGLDMIAPTLMEGGACLTLPQESVIVGASRWTAHAHRRSGSGLGAGRTDEGVMRLLARLENTPVEDAEMARLMNFAPQQEASSVRKTSVSAVIRDEKRAAQEEDAALTRQIERLPRFMQEDGLTGAQIGTAFHRAVRMIDLGALAQSTDMEREIAAQLARMCEDGVLTAQEAQAVPPRMMIALFASPLGVRMVRSARVEREWPFTWRRTDAQGAVQLVQGVIDCCFIENGGWVLVDYKTDSASDVPAAIAKHRPQLEIYAQALAELTGYPVRERILYLVRAGAGYCL